MAGHHTSSQPGQQQQRRHAFSPAGDAGEEHDEDQRGDAAALLSNKHSSDHQPLPAAGSATLHIASNTAATAHQAAANAHVSDQQTSLSKLLLLHSLVWSSGMCCVMVAALIFSVAALLVKLTGGRVPVLEITLLRSGISLVVSAVLIKVKNIRPVLGQRHNIKWLIPRGVFGATAMTTFYAAILLLPLADGMTLFFLNPCLTAVSAWALRGEPLGLLGALGCLVSLVGMVVLIHPPMIFGGHAQWGPRRVWGTGFGLVSAICCAGAFISIRYIGKSEPAIVVAVYFHMSTALLSAVPLAFGWPQAWRPISFFDAICILGVAAGSFLGQLFMTRALQLDNASLISSLNFSQVLYSYLFGLLFFSEHLTLFGVLGSLLVALGMVCVTLPPKAAAPADGAAPTAIPATASGITLLPSSGSGGGSGSFSTERARRLNSFLQLLTRANRSGSISGSSKTDLHLQDQDEGEGLPLRAADVVVGRPLLSDAAEERSRQDAQQQQQQLMMMVQQPHSSSAVSQQQLQQVSQQQLQQVSSLQRPLEQQQQWSVLAHQPRDQLVLSAKAVQPAAAAAVPLAAAPAGPAPLSPVELAETAHSMHHRAAVSPSAPQQPDRTSPMFN